MNKRDWARFTGHTRRAGECLVWTSYIGTHGYGMFHMGSRRDPPVLAHRVAYEHVHGSIPPGLTIDHLCRNLICVRPDHLEAVSLVVNIRRGENWNKVKKFCPRGHPYDLENTRVQHIVRGGVDSVQRACRTCVRLRKQGKLPHVSDPYKRKGGSDALSI